MSINTETLVQALKANIGDPAELKARAERIVTPDNVPEEIRRKFGLIGQAIARQQVVDFLDRLLASDEQKQQQKEAAAPQPQQVASESQYKHPTGSLLRRQSSFRSSIEKTKSFGGMVDQRGKGKLSEALLARLDVVLEDISVRQADSELLADQGQLVVGGQVIIDNHADLLKALVNWFMDNRAEVMQSAVAGISDMARAGTIFRT